MSGNNDDDDTGASALSAYLYGKEEAIERKAAFQTIQRDAILGNLFDESDTYSYRSARKRTMQHIRRATEYKSQALIRTMAECCNSFNMRLGVHEILFRTTISVFGSEEQKEAYMQRIDAYDVVGSFAMTELGHSSSLRDLETTATFDKIKDEFVLDSPTLTSTKWWIGMVGQTATHTVILAQTIVDGDNVGLNWFILQLRDIETGNLMPGVLCGDVGAKAGRDGLDNGWIQLSGVRIPRTAMLMKLCSIDRDGNVEGPMHPALMYATLIPERFTLTFASNVTVGKALTICLKSPDATMSATRKLQLAPILAGLIVNQVAEKTIMKFWERVQELGEDPTSEAYLALLPDVHSISAGLKATITWWTADVLFICQQAVGLSAKLGASFGSIGRAIQDWGVMTTGGGDNYTLAEQSARYIMSNLKRALKTEGAKKPKSFTGSVSYLNRVQNILAFTASPFRLMEMEKMFAWCISLFETLTLKLGQRLLSGIEDRKAFWNQNMVDLNLLSNLHVQVYILSQFQSAMTIFRPPSSIVPLLKLCGTLYALDSVARFGLEIALEEQLLDKTDISSIRRAISALSEKVLQATPMVIEALGYPEFILHPVPGQSRNFPESKL